MLRALAVAALAALVGACASRPASIRAEGPRRAVAVVKVIETTGARLESVNGARVSSPSQIRLEPGDYRLVVRYAPAQSTTEELSFQAEAGHQYELSAASPEVTGGEWTPVLVDDSTQTQIHPKK
jgi:hypothetical protein